MRALNIIETAYRATLEEQDDTIVWLCHAMKAAGADLAVLLRGNAVNYGVKDQKAVRLTFGDRTQHQGPELAKDVTKLIAKGVDVYIVEQDLEERGIEPQELLDGLRLVSRPGIAKLFGEFDQVWHW